METYFSRVTRSRTMDRPPKTSGNGWRGSMTDESRFVTFGSYRRSSHRNTWIRGGGRGAAEDPRRIGDVSGLVGGTATERHHSSGRRIPRHADGRRHSMV